MLKSGEEPITNVGDYLARDSSELTQFLGGVQEQGVSDPEDAGFKVEGLKESQKLVWDNLVKVGANVFVSNPTEWRVFSEKIEQLIWEKAPQYALRLNNQFLKDVMQKAAELWSALNSLSAGEALDPQIRSYLLGLNESLKEVSGIGGVGC